MFRSIVAVGFGVVLLVALAPGTAGAAHQIDDCADDVNNPGLHVVNSSISDAAASSCIDIDANNVVLDGQGNTVDGVDDDSGSVGVNVVGQTNVTVRNLTVTNWNDGVLFDNVDDGAVSDNIIRDNDRDGISLDDSSGNNVTDNNVSSNVRNGIILEFSDGNNVTGNDASDSGAGIFLGSSNDNDLVNNEANSTDINGIFLGSSGNNNLTDNTANENDEAGILVSDFSTNNNLTGNTANNNNQYGIWMRFDSNSNNLTDNVVRDNSGSGSAGIYVGSSQTVSNNRLVNNTATGDQTYGIYLMQADENELIENKANENNEAGIYLTGDSSDNELIDNVANRNGEDFGNGIGIYGIWLDDNSNFNNLTGNEAFDNGPRNGDVFSADVETQLNNGYYGTQSAGIYLGGNGNSVFGNTLIDNEVRDTGSSVGGDQLYGIWLSQAGQNELINNTASENLLYGIWLVQSTGNNLTDNLAENNPEAGIYLGGIFGVGGASDNTLIDNTARGSVYGIWVRNSRNNDISGSLAENNDVGIEFEEDNFFTAGTLADSGNTFTDDTSKNNTDWDFVIETDDPFLICIPNGFEDECFQPLSTPPVSDLPVTNLNIGDSTNPNTLLSFDGDDVQIRSNSTTPPSTPANLTPIGRYFEAENNSANGFLDMTVSYNDTDFTGNESELGLYGFNATTGLWGLLPSNVDTTNNTVSADIVEFSTFGILQQNRDPFFDVEITGTNSPVLEGQKLNVDANVTNTGGNTSTQIIQLDIDGLVVDSQEVTLAPGESTSITLMWRTRVGDAGSHTARVSSDDDNDTAPVEVTEVCINRRNLSRGQEDQECPFDRDISRDGSREELDRNTGRAGDGRHRDSATARRDRSRRNRGR